MSLGLWPSEAPDKLGFSAERLNSIKDLMSASVDSGVIPGAVCVVSRAGKIAHLSSVGFQDMEKKKPLSVDCLFRLYSQTKPVIAALTMRLFEKGLLTLDQPITDFLPEFSNSRIVVSKRPVDHVHGRWSRKVDHAPLREITVRDLLTMTSGLCASLEDVPAMHGSVLSKVWSGTGFLPGDTIPNSPQSTYEENILSIASLPLVATPGTRWHYGIDFDILTLILTRVSGCDLDTLLQSELFAPLGVRNTAFYCSSENKAMLTTEYGWSADAQLEARDAPEQAEKTVGSQRNLKSGNGLFGGLLTTAQDYLTFLEMLKNGGMHSGTQVLGRKSIQQMTTDHIPWSAVDLFVGAGFGFGFGLAVRRTLAESHLPGSVGEYTWGGAAGTAFFVDPSEDMIGLFFTHVFGFQLNPRADLFDRFKARVYQSLL